MPSSPTIRKTRKKPSKKPVGPSSRRSGPQSPHLEIISKPPAAVKSKPARRGTGDTAIGDEAVYAATGKRWSEWFAILDKAGAATLDHKGIVAILSDGHGVKPWWRQMVTVQYERERGLRQVHETSRGFSVSVSRTMAAPITRVYAAWLTPASRRRWLTGEAMTIRKANKNKSLRITWSDQTNVEVMFYSKSSGKTQCVVQHDRLKSAADVERMRKHWSAAMDNLVENF